MGPQCEICKEPNPHPQKPQPESEIVQAEWACPRCNHLNNPVNNPGTLLCVGCRKANNPFVWVCTADKCKIGGNRHAKINSCQLNACGRCGSPRNDLGQSTMRQSRASSRSPSPPRHAPRDKPLQPRHAPRDKPLQPRHAPRDKPRGRQEVPFGGYQPPQPISHPGPRKPSPNPPQGKVTYVCDQQSCGKEYTFAHAHNNYFKCRNSVCSGNLVVLERHISFA